MVVEFRQDIDSVVRQHMDVPVISKILGNSLIVAGRQKYSQWLNRSIDPLKSIKGQKQPHKLLDFRTLTLSKMDSWGDGIDVMSIAFFTKNMQI